MKKFILGLALAMLLASPVAFASTNSLMVEPTGNGDPMKIVQVWGLTGYNTPVVPVGTVLHLGYGLADEVCPAWYPKHMGCFDLRSTEYWRIQLRALGINI